MSFAIFGFNQDLRPLPPLPPRVIPLDPCCRLKASTVTRPCLRCAKAFRPSTSALKRGGGSFCSHDCAHKYRQEEVKARMAAAVYPALREGGLSAVQIAARAGVSRPTVLHYLYALERDRVAVSQPRADENGRRVHGVGWWLADGCKIPESSERASVRAVVTALERLGSGSAIEIHRVSGQSRTHVARLLSDLVAQGRVKATGPARTRTYGLAQVTP